MSTVRGAAWLTAATAQARAQLAAITLDSRDEAVRKRVPLAPRTEPYASLSRCVAPLLAAREAALRADGRWPDDRAGVAARWPRSPSPSTRRRRPWDCSSCR